MEDRLTNPQNSQDAALAKKNGAVKIDFVEFGNFRTRADANGIAGDYKYRGVWYQVSYTSTREEEVDVEALIASGDAIVSPIQE